METRDVIKLLKARQGSMSLREYGKVVECSAAYLYDLYSGKREPGPKILKFLGLKKTRTVETSYARAR